MKCFKSAFKFCDPLKPQIREILHYKSVFGVDQRNATLHLGLAYTTLYAFEKVLWVTVDQVTLPIEARKIIDINKILVIYAKAGRAWSYPGVGGEIPYKNDRSTRGKFHQGGLPSHHYPK